MSTECAQRTDGLPGGPPDGMFPSTRTGRCGQGPDPMTVQVVGRFA